jgi:hypothetical protein
MITYGRPWRYIDKVMSWHLAAVTAVACMESIGLLLLMAVIGKPPLALIYGAGTAVIYWRLWLLLRTRNRRKGGTVTQPVPKATQVRHPWRATLRTAVAAGVALLSLLPTIAIVGHLGAVPGVAQVLTVAGGVTRVLAIPAVDLWVRRYAPWLAPQPPGSAS